MITVSTASIIYYIVSTALGVLFSYLAYMTKNRIERIETDINNIGKKFDILSEKVNTNHYDVLDKVYNHKNK